MSDTEMFQTLASSMASHGIEAEAVTDKRGKITSLRFYLDGKAFILLLEGDAEGRMRIAIQEFEALEIEEPEDRIEHVLEVLRRTNLDG